MTREDAIAKLRRSLPALRMEGITGLSLVGSRAAGEVWDEVDVVLDIDLAAHPKFSLLNLATVKNVLEDELGITVWPYILDGMRDEHRARFTRDLVHIA